jgi:hypothetical protein
LGTTYPEAYELFHRLRGPLSYSGRGFRAPVLLLPYNRAIKALRSFLFHQPFTEGLLLCVVSYVELSTGQGILYIRVSQALFLPNKAGGLRTFPSSTMYQEWFLIVASMLVFLRSAAKPRLQSVVLKIPSANRTRRGFATSRRQKADRGLEKLLAKSPRPGWPIPFPAWERLATVGSVPLETKITLREAAVFDPRGWSVRLYRRR